MTKHSLRDRFRIKRSSEKAESKALSSNMRTLLDRFEADYKNRHQSSRNPKS